MTKRNKKQPEIIAGVALVIALGLETAAITTLFHSASPAILNFILLHTSAAAIATITADTQLGSTLKTTRIQLFGFMFSLFFFIPFTGIIGGLSGLIYGLKRYHPINKTAPWWQANPIPALSSSPPPTDALSIELRSMSEQLSFHENPALLFQKLAATRSMPNDSAIAILKNGLKHADESIRLLAYSQLDARISRLNKTINSLEQEIRTECGSRTVNRHLQLARLYWDLMSLEQGEQEVLEQVLDKAKNHLVTAIRISPGNMNAFFILGQIELKRNQLELSEHAFKLAIKFGFSKDKVLPYLAETAYQKRDFFKVKKYLRQINPVYLSYPPASKIAEQWL